MNDSLGFTQVDLRTPNAWQFCEGIGYGFDTMLTGHSVDF